ncbi:MAG: hypothetical protein A2Y64_09175 [Candidatus Coatesbacteria bacterium RBG_13_66_14]|uniref:Anticodon-binding domain-containing protein n=1 Tax=Candidatus Coatesbacteria bacterium RBG_13_66_14 TaxID=1817816 RepID=A0A1F5FEU5_9BACT|nr:MAG: hypothetical protein A2Y64_09175 [Candidatus Coatesbacteria bacterium RBG_13_66_14]
MKRVLPVAEEFLGYAEKVADSFREKGLRVRVDAKDSKLGAKIASAETAKVKYVVVVGKAEAEAGDINLRPHGKKAFNKSLSEALDGLVGENAGRLLVGRW